MKRSITIEQILNTYRAAMGEDYQRYKNHVYRVYNICLALDANPEAEEKYAIAAAFHDIGIWTDHTFDYLGPSIEHAKRYIQNNGLTHGQDEVAGMILWHHKLSAYRGSNNLIIETFRRADLADVSFGLIRIGLKRSTYLMLKQEFPYKGFHRFLIRLAVKNLLRHPLNPLPMFKR